MEDRDRFILSAGHKCLAQYAALAEKGFFSKEVLDTYGSLGSHIPGHPDMHKLPGVEANTGALGHGLSIATGMALSMRLDHKKSKVYVVMGDGELAEGSNWEAAAAAAHHKVNNLVAFVDFNGLQISGRVQDVMDMTPIADHFKAFGWDTVDIDGNDMAQIVDILDRAPLSDKPTMVVAHTVKSKGLSFGENDVAFHFWNATGGAAEAGGTRAGRFGCQLRERAEGGISMIGNLEDPRKVFGKAVSDLAKDDERIVLLSADSGKSSGFGEFMKEVPERYFEFGIMEQGVLGVAAGFATTGKIPVFCAIAPFVTARPYEMFRNDLGYMRQNAKIVGRNGGISYSDLGATHHSLDDFGLMRLIPGVTILCPAGSQRDPLQCQSHD